MGDVIKGLLELRLGVLDRGVRDGGALAGELARALGGPLQDVGVLDGGLGVVPDKLGAAGPRRVERIQVSPLPLLGVEVLVLGLVALPGSDVLKAPLGNLLLAVGEVLLGTGEPALAGPVEQGLLLGLPGQVRQMLVGGGPAALVDLSVVELGDGQGALHRLALIVDGAGIEIMRGCCFGRALLLGVGLGRGIALELLEGCRCFFRPARKLGEISGGFVDDSLKPPSQPWSATSRPTGRTPSSSGKFTWANSPKCSRAAASYALAASSSTRNTRASTLRRLTVSWARHPYRSRVTPLNREVCDACWRELPPF